jgi:hypothetical protein
MKTMPGNLLHCAVKHFWGDAEHIVHVTFSESGANIKIEKNDSLEQSIDLSPPQVAILSELLGNYEY